MATGWGARGWGGGYRPAGSIPLPGQSALPSRSMRVDAKLIRVINSAAAPKAPTRVSATSWWELAVCPRVFKVLTLLSPP